MPSLWFTFAIGLFFVSGMVAAAFSGELKVVVGLLCIMSILYIIHIRWMYKYLARDSEELGFTPLERFSEGDAKYRIWVVLLIVIFVPTGLLWLPTLPVIHTLNPETITASILETIFYSGNVALLSVLITLEFVQILSFQQRIIREWQVLLVGALALDIMLLFAYTLFLGAPGTWLPHSGLASILVSLAMISTVVTTFYSSYTATVFIEVVSESPENTVKVVAEEPLDSVEVTKEESPDVEEPIDT